MKATLIITTYNWPEALDLVLESLEGQSQKPHEVLIADDGSTSETKALIERFQAKSAVPIKHIWHEDDGFRRTVILNKALAQAEGDYIIQLDGDCIMHKKFVEDHVHFAQRGNFLFGSRVNIKKTFLPDLFKARKVDYSFFDKGISKRSRNLYIPYLSKYYKESLELSRKVRGCNLSYWKEDILKINGYNEDMVGWGKEDSEMVVRLLNNGIGGRRLKFRGIIYHIWHKESSRANYNINFRIQEEAIEQRLTRCDNGINKYL